MKQTITLLSFIFMVILPLLGQVNPQSILELDKEVRYGKLENGLTYYIRHNKLPENRAEFRIFTNVGAIQETPAQHGLAHFLEHMAFNGLESFPDKAMFDYLEGIGAKFGENINASTGVEMTSYMLNNIPVAREGVIDTCLLILHDWSAKILNEDKDINAERGVIIEEWRTRNTADWRVYERNLPYIYGDSKYATCNIIGSVENLENFHPDELRNFYKTWYRPDLQAIIVVGDIDVDQIENKIKEEFSDIKMPKNPQSKVVHKVTPNKEPIIGIVTDAESSVTKVQIMFKSEPIPLEYRGLGQSFLQGMIKKIISQIFSERFKEITTKPNAPFFNAAVFFGYYSSALEAFTAVALTKDGEAVKGFNALMNELERAKRYGFTQAELERAKMNLIRSYETSVDMATTRKNPEFVSKYTNHFSKNIPYLDPTYALEIANGYLPLISVQMLNQVIPMLITDENRVLLVNGPERDGLVYPTEKELNDVMINVLTAELEAPKEEVSNRSLLDASKVNPGKIIEETQGEFGSTIWTLGNGVKVIYKYTDNQKDRFSANLILRGGRSLVENEDLPSIEQNIMSVYSSSCGISDFPTTELVKILTGKLVSVSAYISEMTHGISGGASPKDVEALMQLIYLGCTDPRFEEEEFKAGLAQIEAVLPNLEKQPNFVLQNELYKTAYDSPRKFNISTQMMKKVDFNVLENIYRSLFSCVQGAELYIIGDIDKDVLKPLVEKYIASMPAVKMSTKIIDRKVDYVDGHKSNDFKTEMVTPKVTVFELYTAEVDFNLENSIIATALADILDLVYTKSIREEESGTYGVGVRAGVSNPPFAKKNFSLTISFDTDTLKANKLIEIAKQGLKDIAENGVEPEHLAKIKENKHKKFAESQIKNGYWMNVLRTYYRDDLDINTNYLNMIDKLSSEDIQKFTKDVLKQGNLIELRMRPE